MSSHSFTRQELYDLVWSEPMVKLAARYGISGNGLAKTCRRANIPVPERGYWAKRQAGHKVSKALLPPATADTPAQVTIQPPGKRPAPPAPPPVPATVQEKIDTERLSGKPITVPKTLSKPHRIIDNWLQDNRRTRRESRHDPWLRNLHKPIDGTELEKRRLRILSALFRALEARGYELTANEFHHHGVQIALGHSELQVQLEERIRQVRRRLTDEDREKGRYFSRNQKWTQERVPTGELILKVKEPNRYGMAKEWREDADSPLDENLNDVLAELAGMFEELRLRGEREAAEQAKRWKIEEERRRAEMERKRETIRFDRLLGHCRNWRTAAQIRAFVAAIESGPLPEANSERFAEWKDWALGHADRIDPLRGDEIFDHEVSDYDVYAMRD